jgi:ribosomal protein S18 acetylase RimI-like enzyme
MNDDAKKKDKRQCEASMGSRQTLRTIVAQTDPALDAVRRIYEQTFPASERKPTRCLDEMIGREDYAILVAEIEAIVVGFAVVFIPPSTNDAALLEYLAVDSQHRDGGIGQGLLRQVISMVANRPLLVEVESANDPFAVRRRDFYCRNGFSTIAGFAYQCPLPNAPPMELMLANAAAAVSRNDLDRWIKLIYSRVYNLG